MGKYSKESLDKLLLLIDEISNEKEYSWFKDNLLKKYVVSRDNSSGYDSSISKIYEFCIRDIINKQANKFYEDFKVEEIKTKLIEDFIRMEHFRREDNFEDFCLAMFQQLEGIVNSLVNNEIQNYIIDNQYKLTYKAKDKNLNIYNERPLWQLIFFNALKPNDLAAKISKPILEWDFSERFKTILYYYYFDKKIYNFHDFQSIFFLGNKLYQARNLNHRGGVTSDAQQKIINEVKSESHKYYFKFLGFLEDFTSKLNEKI